MPIYQRNPDAPPDSEFEPGEVHHIVAGNRGRMLDPRRTPVSIVDRRYDTGMFVVRIDGFEDEGALWALPFEEIDRYQFALGSERAPADELRRMREVIDRLDKMQEIACDPAAASTTWDRVTERRIHAGNWLDTHSEFLAGDRALPDVDTRRGDPALCRDLAAYMTSLGLDGMERAFAERYVSAPHAGEIVKGHRIVLAELGLASYVGKIVRDPGTFEGAWARAQRAAHIESRLAFVSALFGRLGRTHVILYRGISTDEPLGPRRFDSFVSTSFSRAVCESHFDAAGPDSTGVLQRQAMPVERVFMTYLETDAMNRQFLEAEAVLLCEPENRLF